MSEIPGTLPPAEKILDHILQDKKTTGGQLTFILTKGLGQAYIANNVSANEVLAFMNNRLHQ